MSQFVTRLLAVLLIAPVGPVLAQDGPRRMSLEEVEAFFSAHSLSLQARRADAAVAAAAARAIGVAPNPTFGFTREAIGDGERRTGETYLLLNQPMRWPGAVSARSRAATQARAAAEARVRADSLELINAVRIAFVDAWFAEQRLEVLQRIGTVVRQVHERGALRMAAGDFSGLDLRRLALEQLRFDRLLTAGVLAVEASRRTLGGLVLPSAERGAVAPAALAGLPANATRFPPVAVRNVSRHPDVLAARAELDLAEAESAAESALRTPPPTLTAGYKHQDDGLQGLLVGAALPLPLFDRRAGPREAASARVTAAQARLEQAERRASDQLAHAQARHAAAAGQAASLAEGDTDTGRDLLSIALVAYQEGELNLLDLLATAEAWRELGTLAAQVRAEYWLSRFELERALGGSFTVTLTPGEGAR